jgi:hypothetical protein
MRHPAVRCRWWSRVAGAFWRPKLLDAAASATMYGPDARHFWESGQMPWTPDDAKRHTHKATTWALKELWAKIANECLERTGDEGRAIREANAVVARRAEATY